MIIREVGRGSTHERLQRIRRVPWAPGETVYGPRTHAARVAQVNESCHVCYRTLLTKAASVDAMNDLRAISAIPEIDPNAMDACGHTALTTICAQGGEHTDRARALLELFPKINVNIPSTIWGRSALHWAAANNNVTLVELLLARGADHTRTDEYGDTPLDLSSSPLMTKVLLQHIRWSGLRSAWVVATVVVNE